MAADKEKLYSLVDELADLRYSGKDKYPKPSTLKPTKHTTTHHYMNKNWIEMFLKRNPIITLKRAKGLDAYRFFSTNKEDLERWFKTLGDLIQENRYEPRDIYDCNDTGYQMGEISDSWLCILPSEESSGPQLGATKAELSTSLEFINAVGYVMFQLMIVKDTTVGKVWLQDVKKKDIRNCSVRATPSGYFNSELFLVVPEHSS